MSIQDLDTKEIKTWCLGCPNNVVLQAIKGALSELVAENKLELKNVVAVTGIGCHAKIYDYINTNAFYGLHGRVLPACLGLSLSNPELTVLGFGGDGDTYAEGISHFVHNCRYNSNVKMFVLNNQVFSLTTGQATPVSEEGFVDAVNPSGTKEKPLNPIELALIAGATFVGRGYALDLTGLKDLMKSAILHRGFSFVDILTPCLIFHNKAPYFQKNVYKLSTEHDSEDFGAALEKGREWDYCFDRDQKVATGIFYRTERPIFSARWPNFQKPWYLMERKINWEKEIKEFN